MFDKKPESYEKAVEMIKAKMKEMHSKSGEGNPEMWDKTVDAALKTCEEYITHGNADCIEKPAFLVCFYRGLLTNTGIFDETGIRLWAAIAAAILLKLERDGKLEDDYPMRHIICLQVATEQLLAKGPKALRSVNAVAKTFFLEDGEQDEEDAAKEIDEAIRNLFKKPPSEN